MTGRKHITLFVAFLLAFFLGGTANAESVVPPKPATLVYDGAAVLTAKQEKELSTQLSSFRDKHGPEIAVAILPSLGDHDIREAGYEIAQTWGVGHKERKDGVLLLVVADKALAAGPGAKSCNCATVEVGEYLEGTLTDNTSVALLTEMLPLLVEGSFYEAVDQGTERLMKAVGGEGTPAPDSADTQKEGFQMPWWGWVLIVMVLMVLQYLGVPVIDIVLHILVIAASGGRGGGGGGGGFGGGSFGGGGGKV